MAISQVSASLSISLHGGSYIGSGRRIHAVSRLPSSSLGSNFLGGSPLLTVSRNPSLMKPVTRARSLVAKCEQSTQGGNSVDVWLGRFAMVGFAAAISVEVATGKGLLENFGLTSPLPVVALAVTGLVGVLTAVFIFQSASKN